MERAGLQVGKWASGQAVANQLIRSVGSICANIEEGYGRGYGKEYSYFLRVSMGSARESRGWYYRARRLLPADVLRSRLVLLDEIIAMLAPNIQRQRQYRRR
ncbi:MAG TPA: four helix bundle protein [Anaerolineae bacterium]|nr:four helix bundle protein [Anaerolineae bacterium]